MRIRLTRERRVQPPVYATITRLANRYEAVYLLDSPLLELIWIALPEVRSALQVARYAAYDEITAFLEMQPLFKPDLSYALYGMYGYADPFSSQLVRRFQRCSTAAKWI